MKKPHFEKQWQWIFYGIGVLTGTLSLLFWIVAFILYQVNQEEEFFSQKFHNRVYKWGIFSSVILVCLLVAVFFFSQ